MTRVAGKCCQAIRRLTRARVVPGCDHDRPQDNLICSVRVLIDAQGAFSIMEVVRGLDSTLAQQLDCCLSV